MKQLPILLALGAIMLFSLGTAATGAGIMIYDAVKHGTDFMKGFELFGIGSILFIVTLSAYMISDISNNVKTIASSLADYMESELNEEESNSPMFMFRAMQTFASSPQNSFESKEKFLDHRNEAIVNHLVNNMGLNQENAKRKFEIMSLEELQSEKAKAEGEQNYELAAMFRDAIEEKKKK
ncbi:MAG: hypothetical protein IT212_05965 [Bacteroidia bacterium]|nr:hypothetical protein [Bacteroidia bacterium]